MAEYAKGSAMPAVWSGMLAFGVVQLHGEALFIFETSSQTDLQEVRCLAQC